MTTDEIIKLAREAGFAERHGIVRIMHSSGAWVGINEEIERFAALVAAAEREACAKLEYEAGIYSKHDMAEAIRARGQK